MLEIRNLCAGYPGKSVLQHVSLTIPKEKVTVILGPNGCGKSTLLRCLCGILPIEKGTVHFQGKSLLDLPPRALAQTVAYLAQSRRVPDITVRRLVLHGRFPYLTYPRRYRPEDHAAAHAAMEQMGILELADSPMEQLSGGQRQKVYIAMALVQNTPVILLDEPTTYLDISHQMQLLQQAKALSADGKTVVMVVHDLTHAMSVADHIVLMEQGRVCAEGTPEEVFASGLLDQVFGVRLGRMAHGSHWHYYCMED